jgi:hypothetical protein
VNMVVANNTIRLGEIQNHIMADNTMFNNIHSVALSTLDRVFRRNSERVKEQRHEYVQVSTLLWIYYHISTAYTHYSTVIRCIVPHHIDCSRSVTYGLFQRVLELEVAAIQHVYIYIDESGVHLTKRRGRGQNIIGHRAIVNVPGRRGGNITMCSR